MNKEKIVCFDNGGPDFGGTVDRYTVCFLDHPEWASPGRVMCLGMSGAPFHPQGFGQHSEAVLPNHGIGYVIPFFSLPYDCQKCVRQDFEGEAEIISCDQDGVPLPIGGSANLQTANIRMPMIRQRLQVLSARVTGAIEMMDRGDINLAKAVINSCAMEIARLTKGGTDER